LCKLLAEMLTEVSDEWIKPDALYWKRTLLIAIELSPPLCFPGAKPIRCLVASSMKTVVLNKSFDQDWTIRIAFLPITR